MGFFKKILGNIFDGQDSNKPDNSFIELVRANDNGEEWARAKIQQMWQSNDETLIPRINSARVVIYEDAAKAGDRDAIIKYARGLEWCDRRDEALQWYMILIDAGDTDAMLELASDYNEYGGMETNEAEEFKWIQKAAMMGNAKAQTKLGTEYMCRSDRENAYIWHKKSAEQGHPRGRAEYAKLLVEDMKIIGMYLANPSNFHSVPRLAEQIKKYNLSADDEYISKLTELYSESCSLSEDVFDECRDESSVRTSLSNLIELHLFSCNGIIKANPYVAAYYMFVAYDMLEDEYQLNRLWDTVKRYNLQITNQTLNEWSQMPLSDWAEKYNIQLFSE